MSFGRRVATLVACTGVACCLTAAPAAAIDPTVKVTQLIVDTWTTNEGLPQDRVQAITQTPDGMLWIGTEAGLARFDGRRFDVYSIPLLQTYRNESITALYTSRSGALWVGTYSGKLVRLQAGKLTTIAWTPPLTPESIWTLTEDSHGELIVGSGAGLLRADGDNLVPIDTAVGPIYTLALGPDHTLWFGGRRGLFRRDANGVQAAHVDAALQATRVNSIDISPDGAVWVGFRTRGVARLKDGRWTHVLKEDRVIGRLVRAMHVDSAGSAWVGTWSGLARIEHDTLSSWVNATGRMPTGIETVFEDRDNTLWVGTMGSGLYRLRQGGVIPHTSSEGLHRDDLLAICTDHQGRVYAGTSDSGVDVYTNGSWRRLTSTGVLANAPLWSCAVDTSGAVWLGSNDGLFVSRSLTVTPVVIPGPPAPLIHSLAATRDGRVWTLTDNGPFVITYGTPTKLPWPAEEDFSLILGEGPDGSLWLSGKRGLYRWHNQTLSVAHASTADGDRILSAAFDPDGTIWLGTAGSGLGRFRNGTVTYFGRKAGLPDLTVAGIADDGLGSMWLATHSGIVRVMRNLIENSDGQDTLRPIIYTSTDGLRSHYTDERGQPSMAVDRRGNLWVSTTRGAAQIYPPSIPVLPRTTGVFIDNISVDGKDYTPGTVAPPGRGLLMIRFSTSARISSPHVRHRWKLEGEDQHWLEGRALRTAIYQNLDPGTYTFVLNAADESATWGPDQVSATIILAPHWYQTWWFRTLAVLIPLTLAAAIPLFHARTSRRRQRLLESEVNMRTGELRAEIQEREAVELALRESEAEYRALAQVLDLRVQERTKDLEAEVQEHKRTELELIKARDSAEAATRAKSAFLANMSHELRTPLNAIIGYSEILLEDAESGTLDSLQTDLDKIRGAGQHLLALVTDLLDLARIETRQIPIQPEELSLRDLIVQVLDGVSALARKNHNTVTADLAPTLSHITADPLRLKQILLNLLSNANKFTTDGSVSLIVRPFTRGGRRYIRFEITDTGIGIAKEDLPKLFVEFSQVDNSVRRRHDGAGLGLVISRRLCHLMGGTIGVTSEPGVGTTFTVILPEMGPRHERLTDDSQ